MATASARAQSGIVRREIMECREDLGRAVAAGVKDPVGTAFRECFEGQLIPRIQVGAALVFKVKRYQQTPLDRTEDIEFILVFWVFDG